MHPGASREEKAEAAILKICVLASSSAGNCTFLGTEQTRILIDAGISRRETLAKLAAIGESGEKIDAILVTHEHSDHVSGLPMLVKGLKVPVFLTYLTAPTIDWKGIKADIELFHAGSGFVIGDIEVDSFTLPHDAIDPVGFCIRTQGLKVSIVTDLGYVPESVPVHVRGSDFLILESNHDLEMLKVGPYPWHLKQRIMGRRGHLSNEVVSEFIRESLDGRTSTLVLGHLSEQNNHPELVRRSAVHALECRSLSTRLVVAEPRRQTEVFTY